MSEESLQGKRIVLCVTGSIAAYKALSLLRTLVEEGAEVSVVMTSSATQFVTPLTFEVLSGRPVLQRLFDDSRPLPHLKATEEANLILVAPATANCLAKCALGLADDLLSTLFVAARCPIVMAPAMDGEMWDHPALAAHVRTLRERGIVVLEPEEGPLASGLIGKGRLPAEDVILDAVHSRLARISHQPPATGAGPLAVPGRTPASHFDIVSTMPSASCSPCAPAQRRLDALATEPGEKSGLARQLDWSGQRVLVSAGPTREPIDAVRFLTNASSGKMGYAMAEAAAQRGAEVTLVSGPTALPPPPNVTCVPVITAAEMHHELDARFAWATVLVMTAAVGDFRPRHPLSAKAKKHAWTGEPLELERTPDILQSLSRKRTSQVLVGFAAESEDLLANGRTKLHQKNLDLLVVNSIAGPHSAFGNETNEVILLPRHGTPVAIERLPKRVLADRILDTVLKQCTSSPPSRAEQPHERIRRIQ